MEAPLPINSNNNKQSLLDLNSLFKKSWEVSTSHPILFLGVLAPAFIVTVLSSYSPSNFWIQMFASGISVWVGLALLYAIKERDQGISIMQALQKGTRGFLLYAWTLILGFFIFWGGFVLFIVPGILLGVWFYFAQYVFVNEKEKGLNALLRSKDLVSGYTWQVFVRLLVPMLIWMTILILVMLLLEMIGIGRDYFTLEPEIIKQHFFIGDAIISILGFMYTVFFSIFGFLIYENIKQVKGNPIFEIPSKKRKLKYLAVGFVGVLLVPIIIISVIIIVFIVKATVLRGIDPY